MERKLISFLKEMVESNINTENSIDSLISELREHEQNEIALRKSEERFRQIAENSCDWFWEVDCDGLYTYSSCGSEKLLGYKPEEIIGKKHFYDFFHPDIKEQFMDAFALLKAIRNSDSLNKIPVIALTASEIGRDLVKNQELNINEYMVKPIDGKQLLECLRNLKIYET